MEELSCIGAVDAHFVDGRAVFAQVLDVAQDVTSSVLTYGIADVGAQSHVCDRRLVVSPFVDREAFVEDETFTIEEFVAHAFHGRLEIRWQGEVLWINACD